MFYSSNSSSEFFGNCVLSVDISVGVAFFWESIAVINTKRWSDEGLELSLLLIAHKADTCQDTLREKLFVRL